jgi:hypothetical protein
MNLRRKRYILTFHFRKLQLLVAFTLAAKLPRSQENHLWSVLVLKESFSERKILRAERQTRLDITGTGRCWMGN